MRIPEFLRKKIYTWSEVHMNTYVNLRGDIGPDFVIGNEPDLYLKRWWIIMRNLYFNIYLHKFIRSDDDRALHDHPWFNCSILIDGNYIEHTPKGSFLRKYGHIYFRTCWASHRVELIDGKSVTTIFITGPRMRNWGFHCPQGWKRWQDFVKVYPGGNSTGAGCE